MNITEFILIGKKTIIFLTTTETFFFGRRKKLSICLSFSSVNVTLFLEESKDKIQMISVTSIFYIKH